MLARSLFVTMVALLALGQSRADAAITTATYFFTQFNTTNPNVSSPYASVTINANDATGLIQFDIAKFGSNTAGLSDFGFNTSIMAADISSATLNSSSVSLIFGKEMSTFGKFAVKVPGPNGANALASLHIELQLSSGNFALATAANVTQANDSNEYFALEYFPGPVGSPQGNTGFVAINDLTFQPPENAPPIVPEPISFAIWGAGLGLFGIAAARRRRHASFSVA